MARLHPQLTVAPFDSAPRLLAESARLFASRFGFIVTITILVYLPGHLLYQFLIDAFEVPSTGILSVLLLDLLDLVLSSLAIPAVVYGLVRKPSLGPSMDWGRRQWARMLGWQLLVDITVILYAALLIIPGLVAMVKLAFVPAIVAIEGEHESRPLERSRELARGRMWRIAVVLLPLMLVDFAADFLLLGKIKDVESERFLFVAAEVGIAVVSQITTIAILLMYLGLREQRTAQRKIAKL